MRIAFRIFLILLIEADVNPSLIMKVRLNRRALSAINACLRFILEEHSQCGHQCFLIPFSTVFQIRPTVSPARALFCRVCSSFDACQIYAVQCKRLTSREHEVGYPGSLRDFHVGALIVAFG